MHVACSTAGVGINGIQSLIPTGQGPCQIGAQVAQIIQVEDMR